MSIQGKTIVFTGKISRPRHEFQALVEKHGGIAGSDISKNTDYLVVGEKPGSKLARATMLGVKTMSEQEFLKLLPEETPTTSAEPENQIEAAHRYKTKIITLNGFLDHPHLVILECAWCNKNYQQWDDLPNYETCPLCEMFSQPLCSNCGNKEPIFVTDYNSYYCIKCQILLEAPFSPKTGWTKHIHIYSDITDFTRKCIFCHHESSIFDEDTFKIHRGPTHLSSIERRQWAREQREKERTKRVREQTKEEEEEKKEEEEALKFLNTLTPERVQQLKEQLNAPVRRIT